MMYEFKLIVITEEGEFEDSTPGYVAAMVEDTLKYSGIDATVIQEGDDDNNVSI